MAKLYRKLLQILIEEPDKIIAEDAEGRAWSFDPDDVTICIRNDYEGSIAISFRAGEVQPVGTRQLVKLEKLLPKSERVERRCISCGHGFSTRHNYRICRPCKLTDEWRYGAEYALGR